MELELIQNKIYEIRGYKVMLDFDLAEMYGVLTKRLKEQVRRNVERFPEDFMFELTKGEWSELVANCDRLPGKIKHSSVSPFAFTEHGVTMLSSILRSEIAVNVSIQIVRVFVAMRQLILNPPTDKAGELQKEIQELKQYIEEVFGDYNDINDDTRIQLELINETLAELQTKERNNVRPQIGYTADRYKKKSLPLQP